MQKALSNETQNELRQKSVDELAQELLETRIALDRKLTQEGYKFRCPITGEYVKSGSYIITKYEETKTHYGSSSIRISRKGMNKLKANFDPKGKFFNKRLRRGRLVEAK